MKENLLNKKRKKEENKTDINKNNNKNNNNNNKTENTINHLVKFKKNYYIYYYYNRNKIRNGHLIETNYLRIFEKIVEFLFDKFSKWLNIIGPLFINAFLCFFFFRLSFIFKKSNTILVFSFLFFL